MGCVAATVAAPGSCPTEAPVVFGEELEFAETQCFLGKARYARPGRGVVAPQAMAGLVLLPLHSISAVSPGQTSRFSPRNSGRNEVARQLPEPSGIFCISKSWGLFCWKDLSSSRRGVHFHWS